MEAEKHQNVACFNVCVRINIELFCQRHESRQGHNPIRRVVLMRIYYHCNCCWVLKLLGEPSALLFLRPQQQVIEAGVHQREAELCWSFCLLSRSAARRLAVHYSALVCVTFKGLPTWLLLPVTPFSRTTLPQHDLAEAFASCPRRFLIFLGNYSNRSP